MRILGINSVYHESAAAIVDNGKIVAAVEEERFNRRKHGKAANVDNPDELPLQSIDYCLKVSGISPSSLDAVAYSFDPGLRKRIFQHDLLSQEAGWGSVTGEKVFGQGLSRVPVAVARALGLDAPPPFHWVRHHLAHAASAFHPSGFDEAAILVVDGIGESDSAVLARGDSTGIRVLEETPFPHSIGFLWEKLCKYLGFSEYDSCKVMGLAAYGDPQALARPFARFAVIEEEGFRLDPAILEFRAEGCDGLESVLGPRRLPGQKIERQHADLAASLQAFTDRGVAMLARRLHAMTGLPRLGYAGGVALNCTTNWHLKEEGPFTDIFIPSAPHDAGTAAGAALAVGGENGGMPGSPWPVYAGPAYSEAEIATVLEGSDWKVLAAVDPAERAAAMIAEGCVVGWFQGRMEFGPRALGNRSLLADPRHLESRERINNIVKRRESFRPFAPSVLEEKAGEWFDTGRESRSMNYMLFACPVRPDKAALIPAVLHKDNTARLQIVRQVDNPRYHALLREFDRLTGVPVLLNTSFNDNEPIVNTPTDALNTFARSPIDALIIGEHLVERR